MRLDLLSWTSEQGARLSRALTQALTNRAQRLRDVARALPKPATLLETASQRLDRAAERLPAGLRNVTQQKRLRLSDVGAARLRPILPTRDIAQKSERLGAITHRFATLATAQIYDHRQRLTSLERMRQTLGYTETLRRGFAVVRGDGAVITDTNAARLAKSLEIEFADGRFTPPSDKAAKPKSAKPTDQGSLF